MIYFRGIAPAADAARDWISAHGADLPGYIRDKIDPDTRTGASPVDLVVHFAEAIYANQAADGVTDEAREIAGGCAALAETFGFHGMNNDSRGSAIALVLSGSPDVEPPDPIADYLPPADPPGPVEDPPE